MQINLTGLRLVGLRDEIIDLSRALSEKARVARIASYRVLSFECRRHKRLACFDALFGLSKEYARTWERGPSSMLALLVLINPISPRYPVEYPLAFRYYMFRPKSPHRLILEKPHETARPAIAGHVK